MKKKTKTNHYNSPRFPAGGGAAKRAQKGWPGSEKPFALLLAALVLLLCLAGCGKRAGGEDSIRIYYINSEKTALAPRSVKLGAATVQGRAEEMLDLLGAAPGEEGLLAPVSGFSRREFFFDDKATAITVDFSGEYMKLDSITEKLIRAAIVRSLCEIPEIRRVTLRVNGSLIVDERGNKSENMTGEQFIYSSGREMLNFERTQIHLYFASEDGQELVNTYRSVVYNGNIPLERLVVEQIIKGPRGDFNYPTVNENTKIINVVTRDNICTVTMDRTFLTNPYPVTPEVALYSIVNSLTELSSIRQVQIVIEGEEEPVFMDTYILNSDNLLQKNPKIVQERD